MISSEERFESLSKNIEEYEKKARRRVWISAIIPLFFGLLLLGYTVRQIQVYGQELEGVQIELTKQTGELNAAISTLDSLNGQLDQRSQDLNQLQVTSTAAAASLESNQQELKHLGNQLIQTTEELQKRSDFLAYSVDIDRFAAKAMDFQYEFQPGVLNFILELQERRIPFNRNGFSEVEGFNSPNFTVYVMQQCGLVSEGYEADSGPQSMLTVIDEPSIGDIVFDETGSGYSMFYFELEGEKFLIGMTPAGIIAVKPEFILTPKYFDVPYENLSSAAPRCSSLS